MPEEEWRVVIDYEGLYEVSNHGKVRSFCRGKNLILKSWKHYKGHLFLYLSKNGERRKFFVHRLVAVAFIPNPQMKLLVNHIDEVKHNNIVTNLEWMTEGENTRYYFTRRGIVINNPNNDF